MTTRDEKITQLLEEREIQRLVNLFDQAANLADSALFGTLWTEDAVWEISEPLPSRATGRQEVVAMLTRLYEPLEFFFRMTQPPVVELHPSGHSATGRASTVELARMQDGKSYANVAFYSDEYRKVGERWLFSGRHYEYVWVETGVALPGTNVTRRRE